MDDHVDKPIEPEQLWAVLLRWLPGRAPAVQVPARAVPPLVDGVDTTQGLRRAGGNSALYARMLASFCGNQAGAMDALGQALARGDRGAAIRLAHTLKGLAGTLGAGALQRSAAALEQRLAGAEQPGALAPLIEQTTRALEQTIRALRRYLDTQVPTAPPAEQGDGTPPDAVVQQLAVLLEASSAEAPELLRIHAGRLGAAMGERFARVQALVDGFEFDEALALLRTWRVSPPGAAAAPAPGLGSGGA